jgi:hypothetical protein
MQSADKRKNPRRAVTYPAFIELGDGLPARPCVLRDASQGGAHLAVADPKDLPDEFILALSSDGAARRRCRVAWRTESEVGVEFVKELKASRPPRPMPVTHASVPTAAVPPVSEAVAAPAMDKLDIDTLPPR